MTTTALPIPSASALAATLEIIYLRPVLESLPGELKKALDVGAHKGDVTEALTEMGFEVLAVEPSHETADRFARRHAEAIRAGSIRLARCAASDHRGEADLLIGSASTVSTLEPRWTSVAFPEEFRSPRSQRVPLVPLAALLDEQDFGPVGFAKIDVEGHELQALRGLFDPGLAPPPVVMFEANQRFAGQACDCLHLLRSQGYSIFDIFIRVGIDPVAAERFDGDDLPAAWRACGDRYFYANIIAYHQSFSGAPTGCDPASANDRDAGKAMVGQAFLPAIESVSGGAFRSLPNRLESARRDKNVCPAESNLSSKVAFSEEFAQALSDPAQFVRDYHLNKSRDLLRAALADESQKPVPVHPVWHKARLRFREYLLEQDWHDFLRNPDARQMFVRGRWGPAQDLELAALRANPFGRHLLANLRDPDIGSPRFSEQLPGLSTNMLGMAWYLQRIHEQCDGQLPRQVIEVGGGYGAFAYAYAGTFPDAQYVIVDLPEMLAIQHYFLTLALPNHSVVFAGQDPIEPTPGQITLVPVNRFARHALRCKLLVSTFAMSEMPRELQRQIEQTGYFDAHRLFLTGQLSSEFPGLGLVSHGDVVGAVMQQFQTVNIERLHIGQNYLLTAGRIRS